MEAARFDRLVRAIGRGISRREVVAGLLSGLLPPLFADDEMKAKGRRRSRGRGHGKTRHLGRNQRQRKGHGQGKGKQSARQPRAEAVCFPGSPCPVGAGNNLAKCDFARSAALKNAICTGCNLDSANLTKADASGASLSGANLNKACLVDANLAGADLTNTNTKGAIFCRTVMPNGSVNNRGCEAATGCCPTCKPLGEGGCALGGSCCGGGVCQGNVCVCPSGRTNCSGVCKNLQTDRRNCGRCGAVCPATSVCSAGACVCDPAMCAATGGCCVGGVCDPDREAWRNWTTFGSGGSGPNQFNRPRGVAVAPDGQTAWVTDGDNNRVAVWIKTGPMAWANLTTFGSSGAGPGQFNTPRGVAAAPDGQTVWVVDQSNDRVSVWTKTGATTWANAATFGSRGSGPSEFKDPVSVAVSPDGLTVWVVDLNNDRVAVWTRTGPTTWANLTTFGSRGTGPNQFSIPSGVAVAPDGQTVWVTDGANNRVSIWTKTGPTTWANLTTFGSRGSGPSQFSIPRGVAVSPDGETAWVADGNNDRVSIWTKTGPTTWANQTTFGSSGSGPSEFTLPFGVAAAPDGLTVWIADVDNNRVSVWSLACPAG